MMRTLSPRHFISFPFLIDRCLCTYLVQVEMTQTINGLFGCGAMVPGTGIMLNNTQNMFDPHPDMPHSVAPGKRVTSSMAPTIVLYPDGSPFFAVGLPGASAASGSCDLSAFTKDSGN